MGEITLEAGRRYRSLDGRVWTTVDPQDPRITAAGWVQTLSEDGIHALHRANGNWSEDPENIWTLVEDVTEARND